LIWAVILLPLVVVHCKQPANAQAMYSSAHRLFLHGHLEASQREAEHGYTAFHLSSSEWASKFQLLEAEAMVWRGMYEDALQVLSAYDPKSTDSEEAIHKLALEGVAFARLQQFSTANEKLLEAERICTGANYTACSEVAMGRGVVAIEHGEFADARSLFQKCLNAAHSHSDRVMELTALLNLGFVSLQINHYDEAVDWSNLAYRSGVELADENQIQGALGNLGSGHLGLGDTERALELFTEAKKRAATLGNIRDEVKWVTTVGYVNMSVGNIDSARRSYEESLKLAQKIKSNDDVLNALESLAQVEVASGNPERTDTFINRALSMVKQTASRPDMLDVVAIQMQSAALRGDRTRAEQLLREVEAAPESQASMKWASELAMAKLYDTRGRTSAAQHEYTSALATFENARAELHHEDSQLPFTANATRIYDDYIQFLIKQGKTNEALILADQSRARTLAQGLGVASQQPLRPVTLSPQAVARKAGATLLFYWLGGKQSYLWAITPDKTTLFPLPAQSEIKPLIERYRKTLLGVGDPLQSKNETGSKLFTMLVGPVAHLIHTDMPVMILADGALSQLNFETLIAPGQGADGQDHYWIEDVTLSSAPSLAMLAAAKTQRNPGGKMLLLGDPVSPGEDYPELPFAASEIQQIRTHFTAPNEMVFARQQATPVAYLSSDPKQFAYIHFVSHGVASRTDPLDSAIILSRATTADDGFKLYAREVMKHPIDARLVTISACYGSGTRAYVGEGLVGLSWAFLRAGAHNAIGALWEASDESTPRLMDKLYAGIDSGQTPAVALRNAKLALLHSHSNFRKPFYWAPFQMYTRL
jgi:CHAT domain-containing protein